MRIAAFDQSGILKVFILGALLGICLACASTWLMWSLRLGTGTPMTFWAPIVLLVVSYSAVVILGFGNRHVPTVRFGVAYLAGLLMSLLIGVALSEMIYCSFDRAGCINL